MSCLANCLIWLLEAGTELIWGKLGAIIVFHKRGPNHAMVRAQYDFLVKISVKCLTTRDSLWFGAANSNKAMIEEGDFWVITLCITTIICCFAMSPILSILYFAKIGLEWASLGWLSTNLTVFSELQVICWGVFLLHFPKEGSNSLNRVKLNNYITSNGICYWGNI